MAIIFGILNRFSGDGSMANAQGAKPGGAEAEKSTNEIALPAAKTTGKMSLEEAIQKRKSAITPG